MLAAAVSTGVLECAAKNGLIRTVSTRALDRELAHSIQGNTRRGRALVRAGPPDLAASSKGMAAESGETAAIPASRPSDFGARSAPTRRRNLRSKFNAHVGGRVIRAARDVFDRLQPVGRQSLAFRSPCG